MRNIILPIALLLLLFLCAAPRLPAAQPAAISPGLAALAPEILVVVGKHAPRVEQQAAEQIAAAFHAAGGPADNLLDDETAFRDMNRSAYHHLILVGTYSSNEMLRQQWGHFALDRAAFRQERAVPTDIPRPPFYAGASATGFYIYGFGTFADPATGYLESGRNDLCLLPRALDPTQQPFYKLRINVTGAGSAGVANAAQALLHSGLLNGVLPAPAETLPAGGDAFTLARERYTAALPGWVPADRLLGWTLPDAGEYAGSYQAGGQPPEHLWRVKYLTDGGITDFETAPQRRSSRNELFIAQYGTPAAAQQALAQLIKLLSAKPQEMKFDPLTVTGQPAQHAGDFILLAVQQWLLMETLPAPQGQHLLESAVTQIEKGEGK